MKRKVLDSLTVAGIGVLGAAASGDALGQEAPGSNASEALEEVVVTATRRTLSLQDVPISIMALSSDDLEMQGIESIERLQGYIPNLNIIGGTNGGVSEVGFSIRGIPRVGFYVDGIWQPHTSGMMDHSLEDVERIEVLRGPQGTLYGRDSTGGSIRVVTSQPSEEFAARALMTLGTYNRRDANVSVDVPMSENVRTRFSASQLQRDGYVHSTTLNKDLGQIDIADLTGDLLWTPTDRFTLRAKYSDYQSHPTDARISLWHIPQGANLVGFQYGATGLYTLSGHPYDAVHQVAGYPGGLLGEWETSLGDSLPATIKTAQASVEVTYDLTDSIALQSWTGYIDHSQEAMIDWDNSPWEAISVYQYNKSDLFSQELQLSGSRGRLDWVGGVYYWNESSNSRAPFWGFEEFKEGRFDRNVALATPECQTPSTLLGCAGAFAVYEGIGEVEILDSRAEDGFAFFGEVVIGLTDRLDLTIGARYHEQDLETSTLNPIPGVTAVKPEHVGPFTSGDPFAGTPAFTDAVSFDKVTSRLVLSREFSDDVMGYFSYSEGFNAGGADPVSTGTGRRLIKFDPELIKTYELGLRSDLASGRLRFNASLFHTRWEDIQIRSNFVDPTIGVYAVTIITQNVAGADADGFETEITWLPIDNLELSLNLGLLDTGYTTFLLGDETPVSVGDDFAQAPEETYSIGLQHTAQLQGGAEFTSRIDYSYVSGFQRYADPLYHPKALGLGDYYEAGDYGLVNARFVYAPAGAANWQVAVFGTNLTNERVINGGFYGSIWELDWSTVARPREAGVELKLLFD
jgi:iron complex outermembrane receptor protein